jgi:hypothetical protein
METSIDSFSPLDSDQPMVSGGGSSPAGGQGIPYTLEANLDDEENEPPDVPLERVENGANMDMTAVSEAQAFDEYATLQTGVKQTTHLGMKVLIIVHQNGVHHLPIRWCRCPGHQSYDLQALDAGFYPASYRRIRTLMTFDVLDDFLAENQECKSTAAQYYDKLRRFTSPSFPHTIPVSQRA